jgi:hypothetical protein
MRLFPLPLPLLCQELDVAELVHELRDVVVGEAVEQTEEDAMVSHPLRDPFRQRVGGARASMTAAISSESFASMRLLLSQVAACPKQQRLAERAHVHTGIT